MLWVGGLICLLIIAMRLGGPVAGINEIVRVGVRDAKFHFSELKKGGTERITIAESTDDNGELTWSVPADIAEGDDYMICISSPADQNASTIPVTVTEDVSNVNFHVSSAAPPAEMTLVSPNWGEQWVAGSTETIEWRPGNAHAGPVKIELLHDGKAVQTGRRSHPQYRRLRLGHPRGHRTE